MTVSGADLTLLRSDNHRSQFYLTPCPATQLWTARVNGALDRGETAVTFDGGSGTNWTAVGAYQELWIGSAVGLYDVGRIRIRSVSSGDSGVSGTVTVAANSILYSDNDYLTFIGWYIPKPIRPLIGGDGTFYKDGDVTYSDQNSQPSPVCIAGENRASFIDNDLGYWQLDSVLGGSYATAFSTLPSTYAAALVYGPASPTISINSGNGSGYIRFSTPGLYWIKWSVTDSNGKTQDSYRWYYAHSTDTSSAHYPITSFSINNISGDWDNGGWSCGIELYDNAALADIPDFCPIIVWADNWYGETKKNITVLPNQSGTVINGYVVRDQFNEELEAGSPTASFEIQTIQNFSEQIYNFSVSLEASQTVDKWWKYASWLSPARAAHHFLKYHSTMLELCDVIGLENNNDPIAYAELQEGNVMQMIDSFLRDRSIRAHLVCDRGGRLHMVEDIQLRPDAERASLNTAFIITDADKSGEISYPRQQISKTPFVHTSGFQFTGSFDSDGAPIANAICAIAPGEDVEEYGSQPTTFPRQTFTGQTHANQIAGRVLAAENNEYSEIVINFSGNYLGVLPIHSTEMWELTTATGDTLRQIAMTNNLILRSVTGNINTKQGTVLVTAVFEAEAIGDIGQATDCPTFPDLPGFDYTIPDLGELSGAVITAASVNFLGGQTKSWTQHTAEATNHMYADPHWPITQDSYASADAILWRCGSGYIKRSTDGGENWSTVTPGDDPPNDAGDTPAPTAGGVNYVMGDGSYINDQEHVFIARWQNASDDWRSWIVHTANNGTAWTWQSIAGGSAGVTLDSAGGQSGLTPQSRTALMLNSNQLLSITYTEDAGASGGWQVDLIDVTDGTILDSVGGSANGVSAFAIARLSDTRFVVFGDNTDGGFSYTTVYNVSSGTMTDLAIENVHSEIVTAVAIERIDDTHYIVAYNKSSAGTEVGTYVIATFNGTDTITYSAETAFSGAAVSSMAMQYMETPGSDHIYDLYYSSASQLFAVQIAVNTGSYTPTTGTPQQIVNTAAAHVSIARLDDDRCICAYADGGNGDDGYAVIASIGNSSKSVGSPVEFKDAATIISTYCAASGDAGYIAYTNSPEDLEYIPFTANVTAVSFGSAVEFPGDGEFPVVLLDGLVFALMYKDAADDYKTKIELSGGGNNNKALGVSLSKGIGDVIYVTYWDTTQLAVTVFQTDFTPLGSYSLGLCTEAQLAAKTYIAFPYVPFGEDEFCYFYGRMNDPASLGTCHIIYTDDLAQTYYLLENGFGSGYCGAFIDDFGAIYAIRNAGNQAKLYTGDIDGSLSVVSTIPIPSFVNPSGLAYSFIDDAMYAGAGRANSIMVMRSNYPFTEWTDITYNHSTASGIKAVVPL